MKSLKPMLSFNYEELEMLILHKQDIKRMKFDNLGELEIISLLIENDFILELIEPIVKNGLLKSLKIDPLNIPTKKIPILVNETKKLMSKFEAYWIDLRMIDISLFERVGTRGEQTFLDIIKNRDLYRLDSSKMLAQIELATNEDEIEEIKASLNSYNTIKKIKTLVDTLFMESIGLVEIESDELDEYGYNKILTKQVQPNIMAIPMYFKAVEELKMRLYDTSENGVSDNDLLKSRRELDRLIEAQKKELIGRGETL